MKSLPPTRAALATLVLAPLLLVGCSGTGTGEDDPASAPAPSTAASVASPAPALPSGVTPAPIPTKVANDVDDRKNVVLSDCAATENGWGASGTATNPTKKNASYAITVFFTTTSATTVDSAKVTVEVKAGDTAKWSATKKFDTPKEMLCVLRGVAAS